MKFGDPVRIRDDAESIIHFYRGRDCTYLTPHPRLPGRSMLVDRPPHGWGGAQILVADKDLEPVE